MKFGKRLQQHVQQTLPGWEDKYLCYKGLKKALNLLPISEADFLSLLDNEIDKFNAFFMEKEEDFIIRHQELQRRIRMVAYQEQMSGIRKDVIDFHGEMVLLINYSNINYTGLAKILKKYDKRTGAMLRLPFIQKVIEQPFYMTDLVSKLVKECELTIDAVFPLANKVEGHVSCSGIRSGGDGIFGNTVAALLTMQEMRRGSSTYSHFSLPPLNLEDCVVIEDMKIIDSSSSSSSSSVPIAS
uniref:SPX domain-containing protein n=1 Tax=Kalanchoe fedtschenkoi TaxID=63787 RepID=A0A7N0ZQU2_KALFE